MIISKMLRAYRHRALIMKLLRQYFAILDHPEEGFWGSITVEDRVAVENLVKRAAALEGPIVEVGCLFGFSAQLIADNKADSQELITIDDFSWNPFQLSPADHRAMTERALYYCLRHCKTRIFDGKAADFYSSYDGQTPAMIFIDADHSYDGVARDIKWAVGMKIPIISGHDYFDRQGSIKRAVDDLLGGPTSVEGSVWAVY